MVDLPQMPQSLRTRPRDGRGYPIPFIVLIDTKGRPHFTISDAEKVKYCIRKRVCGLCSKRMTDGLWFIGGPRCFLDPYGAFLDPPNHYDCARYALEVCPYLAAPHYDKLVDGRTLDPKHRPANTVIGRDEQVIMTRPPLFMLGRTDNFEARPGEHPGPLYLVPYRPMTGFEYWERGVQLSEAEGHDRARDHQLRAVAS